MMKLMMRAVMTLLLVCVLGRSSSGQRAASSLKLPGMALPESYSRPGQNSGLTRAKLGQLQEQMDDFAFKRASDWGMVGRPLPPGFRYENCGGPHDAIEVSYLSVQPDPIPVKGDVTFSVHMAANSDIVDPLKIEVKTQKKQLGGWTDIECHGFWGTCVFDDMCKLLDRQPVCPPQLLRKMPCKCPFKKSAYTLDNSKLRTNLPGMARGMYRSTVIATTKDQSQSCLQLYYNVF